MFLLIIQELYWFFSSLYYRCIAASPTIQNCCYNVLARLWLQRRMQRYIHWQWRRRLPRWRVLLGQCIWAMLRIQEKRQYVFIAKINAISMLTKITFYKRDSLAIWWEAGYYGYVKRQISISGHAISWTCTISYNWCCSIYSDPVLFQLSSDRPAPARNDTIHKIIV